MTTFKVTRPPIRLLELKKPIRMNGPYGFIHLYRGGIAGIVQGHGLYSLSSLFSDPYKLNLHYTSVHRV